MKIRLLLPLLLSLASAAHGGQILNLVVDTSTLNGTSGSIDFQFNPGLLATQSATVQILNFTGATYLNGTQSDVGGVSGGPLPSTITIANSGADNEDFEDVKFGNWLSFTLNFDGPAVTSPNGSLSSSIFALSLYGDAAGTTPVLTSDPNGVLATVQIDRNTGSLITGVTSTDARFTPEPSSLLLFGGGLLALAARARLFRRSRRDARTGR